MSELCEMMEEDVHAIAVILNKQWTVPVPDYAQARRRIYKLIVEFYINKTLDIDQWELFHILQAADLLQINIRHPGTGYAFGLRLALQSITQALKPSQKRSTLIPIPNIPMESMITDINEILTGLDQFTVLPESNKHD